MNELIQDEFNILIHFITGIQGKNSCHLYKKRTYPNRKSAINFFFILTQWMIKSSRSFSRCFAVRPLTCRPTSRYISSPSHS